MNDDSTRRALKILLVEDHADSAYIMERMLSRKGFDVSTCRDIQSAKKTIQTGSFDVLVSDLGLPDGSGLELMRHIRAAGHSLPAIALTGFGMESDHINTTQAGFNHHLLKPVDVNQLESLITRLIENSNAASQHAS